MPERHVSLTALTPVPSRSRRPFVEPSVDILMLALIALLVLLTAGLIRLCDKV